VSTPAPKLAQAFDLWLAHQRVAGRLRRGSSEAVYRAMWLALVTWCTAQRPRLRLNDLHGDALLRYLASRHGQQLADGLLTPRYQQRLRSLVRRVQAHETWRQQQAQAAPAQALALARSAPADRAPILVSGQPPSQAEPPLHLLAAAVVQLQALLAQPVDGRWQTGRDRCAVALMLGAGLGPGDVRALRLVDALRQSGAAGLRWQLAVAANGSAPAHMAPLADWAGAVLGAWLERRAAEGIGGPWLLPSTRSGKPWGKVAQYEAAHRVLADAGLPDAGGGSFRLRHSFALRQLQHGHAADTVAGWLGTTDPQVMLRYQQVLAGWPTAATPATPAAAGSALPWPV
jgi:integrase